MDEPALNQPAPAAQPGTGQTGPSQTGKSKDPFKMWTVLLALLFLATAGFAAWQYMQLNDMTAKVNQLETDKKSLQAEISKLDDGSLVDADEADADTADSTNPDTTKILAAVDAYVRAPVDATAENFEYAVAETSGDFARVNVTPAEGGGYALWVKKVGDNWTVLLGGQSAPAQEDLDKYGIPEAVLQ